MELSASSLFAGFVFGVFGIFLIKRGRDRANVPWVLIGAALCVFPYFVPSALLTWIVGATLLGVAFKLT